MILPLLIILSICLFVKNKGQKLYFTIPALTIVLILLIVSIGMAYDVQDHQKDSVFTKVSHILADYDLNLEIEEGDRVLIHNMMNETAIKENYNIHFSDSMYRISNKSVYDANKGTYLNLAIKYSLQNPLHFIQYFFESSAIVWDLTRDSDWKGSVYATDYDGECERFYDTTDSVANDYDNVLSKNKGTPMYNSLNSFVNNAKDNVILDLLFNSVALYMYLSIIILAIIQIITNSRKIYLVYIPNLLNIFYYSVINTYTRNKIFICKYFSILLINYYIDWNTS